MESFGKSLDSKKVRGRMTIKAILARHGSVQSLLNFISQEVKPASLDLLIDLGMQHLQSDADLWRAFEAAGKVKREKALLAAGIVAYESYIKELLD